MCPVVIGPTSVGAVFRFAGTTVVAPDADRPVTPKSAPTATARTADTSPTTPTTVRALGTSIGSFRYHVGFSPTGERRLTVATPTAAPPAVAVPGAGTVRASVDRRGRVSV